MSLEADAAAITTLCTAGAALVASIATLVGVILTHGRVQETKSIATDTNRRAVTNAAAVETVRQIVTNGHEDLPASPASPAPGTGAAPSSAGEGAA